MLLEVIRLACRQRAGCFSDNSNDVSDIVGYRISPTNGLVLLWTVRPNTTDQLFLVPLDSDSVVDMVLKWLQSSTVSDFPCKDKWDEDLDHDGSNAIGWRACVEDWGHIDNLWGVVVAIRPTYLWYGK